MGPRRLDLIKTRTANRDSYIAHFVPSMMRCEFWAVQSPISSAQGYIWGPPGPEGGEGGRALWLLVLAEERERYLCSCWCEILCSLDRGYPVSQWTILAELVILVEVAEVIMAEW